MFGRWLGFQRVLLVVCVIASGLAFVSNVNAQQGGTNLLVNGDFEYFDWGIASWPLQDGIAEVQVCPGWRAYYVDEPPAKAKATFYWRRPEFRDVKAQQYPNRVHGGWFAAKYFSFAGQHEAGFYQQVSGIKPGTPLRFSVYMQLWSCMAATEWNICPTGDKSNNPSKMHPRVGIDPTGGTDPWSPNVVWSPEIEVFDVWTYYQVEAVAQNSTVTVFTYTWADWTEEIFRMHNDVYVDDAVLIALNEVPATATPEPPAPTATLDPSLPTPTPAPTATPAATPTPRPDGAIVHVVKEGDTLSAIAKQYQITVETLVQLNGLTDVNKVLVGQELVISVPAPTATPEATATPIPPLPTPTAVPPTPTAAPPTPTAVPPTATALPTTSPVVATPAAPATPTAQKTSTPWGLVVGIGIALIVGAGIGFTFGRKR